MGDFKSFMNGETDAFYTYERKVFPVFAITAITKICKWLVNCKL